MIIVMIATKMRKWAGELITKLKNEGLLIPGMPRGPFVRDCQLRRTEVTMKLKPRVAKAR